MGLITWSFDTNRWLLKRLPSVKVVIMTAFMAAGFALSTSAQCDFKPIGHRGGSSYYYPENTLVSLEQGFMEDIFAAEIDIRYTADSVLVLMHDSYIDRTTNARGNVGDMTLAYLKTLDAGSWKGPEFKGTPVPTLKEALLLAKRYQKKLYLNMKVFAPQLIARTLKETGVPDDLVMLDPDDLDKVAAYHKAMPNTPLVYFGELPANVEDASFYEFLKNNGAIAIEIPADYIRHATDDYYIRMKNMAHAHGLELWAYTVNDAPYFKLLKDFGIDALETDRPSEAMQVFCNNTQGGYFPEKRITGQWDFTNKLMGTIGSQLGIVGDTTVAGQNILFGTTASFKLPAIENTAVKVARIPAFDSKHALRFFSNIAPEGLPGVSDCDNTYSLVFDLLKPEGGNDYTALLQTSNNNSDDADLFLRGASNGVGILEQYKGSFADSTWVRIALVFDLYNQKMDEYIDGTHVGSVVLNNSQDGRFCINNNWGVQSSNFFSDNDGETNPLFVSSIQIRNYAMSDEEIRLLGKPKASKIENTILVDENTVCPEFTDGIQLVKDENGTRLEANAGDTVNYRWEMNSGSGWETVKGESFLSSMSSSLRLLKGADEFAGYKFRCIAFNDCQSISDEILISPYLDAVLVEAPGTDFFVVYPNPSRQLVNIDFRGVSQNYALSVYSVSGIEVYRQKAVKGKSVFSLPAGTYIVKVNDGRTTQFKKLIMTE